MDYLGKLKAVLKDAKKRNDVVAIHVNPDDQELFEAGYVAHVDDDWVSLKSLSKHGVMDGLIIIQLADILAYGEDSEYLRGLDMLWSQHHDEPSEPVLCKNFTDAFRFAKTKNDVVSIVMRHGETYSGFVRDFGDDFVQLEIIGDNAKPDGTFLASTDDIRKVLLGGAHEITQKSLHKNRYAL
jgi:hypothetical protein